MIKPKFEKVSFEQFCSAADNGSKVDWVLDVAYNDVIKLPKRATKGSAGYDFVSPYDYTLRPGETVLIPTGIRCKMDESQVLLIVPRSGLGFKYRMQLNNTVGVIDSDYYYSDNEGHIMVKITNDSNEGKTLEIKEGMAFCQGIFINYITTEDDDADGVRNGGFGSTTK